jgi:hypothetical protein
MEPDKDRLKELIGITEKDTGLTVLFCPRCKWQLDPGAVCKPVCPQCTAKLHFVVVDDDLLQLIKKRNCLTNLKK